MDDATNAVGNAALDLTQTRSDGVPFDEYVFNIIRTLEEYRPRNLVRPVGMKARDFQLAIHAAEERLRQEDGILFQPARGRPGVRRRATTASQAAGRAARFARAARKKLDRAAEIEEVAKTLTDDPEERRQLERRQLKRENAALDSMHAMRRAAKPRPKGL